MTREEAIMVLEMVDAYGLADEAKKMAISALSAEPSDLISRADAMSKCKNAENELTDEAERKGLRVARFIIGELPSADRPTMIPINIEKRYPMSRDEDITDAFTRGYEYGIKSDRPSGEWEYDVDADDSFCTNCHKYAIRDMEMQLESDFCPSCGARMENTK